MYVQYNKLEFDTSRIRLIDIHQPSFCSTTTVIVRGGCKNSSPSLPSPLFSFTESPTLVDRFCLGRHGGGGGEVGGKGVDFRVNNARNPRELRSSPRGTTASQGDKPW